VGVGVGWWVYDILGDIMIGRRVIYCNGQRVIHPAHQRNRVVQFHITFYGKDDFLMGRDGQKGIQGTRESG